jgi:hypothetical protein
VPNFLYPSVMTNPAKTFHNQSELLVVTLIATR